MQISENGKRFIRVWETFKPEPYLCPAGVNTIGYGHAILPAESFPGPITEAQAEAILANDLRTFERAVRTAVTVPLMQHEYDALVSFVFNVGPGNFRGSTMLKKLNSGDKAGASTEMLKWHHVKGVDSPGLKTRREQEKLMFREGIYEFEH